MRFTTELERKRTAILKAYRTAIRLKYALQADEEIGRRLPEIEEQINTALASGKPLELNPGDVFFE